MSCRNFVVKRQITPISSRWGLGRQHLTEVLGHFLDVEALDGRRPSSKPLGLNK